ncbi:MAG: alanyl-tRNA editing protein [Marinobacter sp.]|uniref:alanyl-tRNA editing protein n=1 Tax=Marinobacter sp. TaxID=50741 RepID=UPI00299CF502|nr:alanyl-tRNA editing protein [Marinobacter sp.]MDX1756158.1 alanyl-tRNA editing protein [Marinobacter sp.]
MRRTIKQYYLDPSLSTARATIVNLDRDTIELDRTIAYPAGGGQESDTGTITSLRSGRIVRFVHCRKVRSTPLQLSESVRVQAGGIILHRVHADDYTVMSGLEVGDEVRIDIDAARRQRLSTAHSASHVLYMGIAEIRPDLIEHSASCHVRDGYAQFDFLTNEKVSRQELAAIERVANDIIRQDASIRVFSGDMHPDARYWECEGFVIPCGGTHLKRTGSIGQLQVQRQNAGRGKERISCSLDVAHSPTGQPTTARAT